MASRGGHGEEEEDASEEDGENSEDGDDEEQRWGRRRDGRRERGRAGGGRVGGGRDMDGEEGKDMRKLKTNVRDVNTNADHQHTPVCLDMQVFGCEPLTDALTLVSCNFCQKPIRKCQFAVHAERCSAMAAAKNRVGEEAPSPSIDPAGTDGNIAGRKRKTDMMLAGRKRKTRKKGIKPLENVGDSVFTFDCTDGGAFLQPHPDERHGSDSGRSIGGGEGKASADAGGKETASSAFGHSIAHAKPWNGESVKAADGNTIESGACLPCEEEKPAPLPPPPPPPHPALGKQTRNRPSKKVEGKHHVELSKRAGSGRWRPINQLLKETQPKQKVPSVIDSDKQEKKKPVLSEGSAIPQPLAVKTYCRGYRDHLCSIIATLYQQVCSRIVSAAEAGLPVGDASSVPGPPAAPGASTVAGPPAVPGQGETATFMESECAAGNPGIDPEGVLLKRLRANLPSTGAIQPRGTPYISQNPKQQVTQRHMLKGVGVGAVGGRQTKGSSWQWSEDQASAMPSNQMGCGEVIQGQGPSLVEAKDKSIMPRVLPPTTAMESGVRIAAPMTSPGTRPQAEVHQTPPFSNDPWAREPSDLSRRADVDATAGINRKEAAVPPEAVLRGSTGTGIRMSGGAGPGILSKTGPTVVVGETPMHHHHHLHHHQPQQQQYVRLQQNAPGTGTISSPRVGAASITRFSSSLSTPSKEEG
ncbi:hypothetical protein CBR_g38889 [Chara braunii]|uniref:SCA7 domain-containing protein n=1 Tax=Chara braunii TaxID=69332 RepID=A0A388LQK1_CHABU|nr:hypothetical protein CBR_g38889 [Chara braunii]|eukprot:GBG84606.1 hypothetical protein CBR_g38889 [Chara braunii]